MTLRVIQWATGVVAKEAVTGIVGHADLELVGARTYAEDKDGADVGDLCGLGPLGVVATRDVESLLASKPDCVSFMVGRSWVRGSDEHLAELLRILRSGVNVVSLWWPALVYAKAMDGDVFSQLDAACQEGGSSFLTAGMDPGYGTASLALAALPMARRVRKVHMTQFMNNGHWEGEGITFFYGFGQADTSSSPMLQPGVTTGYHETTLRLISDAIGVTLDEIVETHQVTRAEVDFDIAAGHIAEGTVAALRYQVSGLVAGEPRVVVEHVEKLREDDFSELGFPGDGYRAEVTGETVIRLDMTLRPAEGFVGDHVAVASAMSAVNAIPAVCAAPPGVLSLADLPPFPSRNVGAQA